MDSHLYDESYRFRQSGITVSITNPAIQAAQTVSQLASAASRAGDDRTRALAGAAGTLSLYNAYTTSRNVMDAVEGFTNQNALNANAASVGGINVSVSLGSTRSRTDSEGEQHTPFASNVLAAGNLAIHAEGAGEASDVHVTASRLSAGGDITLAADHRIVLEATTEHGFEHSANRSSSAAIGVGIALGAEKTGISFNASASRNRGHADGEHLAWLDTQVEAGGTLSLASGGDTLVRGAQLYGQHIVADIGGDLLLESLQDAADYNARQRGSGFALSVCLPPICTGASSLRVSANRARVDGDYLSVVEQTGLFAGDGGFDITVAGHTQLNGAVIASTQAAVDAGVNRLETGSLGFTDLQNHAEANASSRGFTLSTDMLTQGKYGLAKGILANQLNQGQASGSSHGFSRAAVSEGTLVIRDETAQLAHTGRSAEDTLAELNRETLGAHRAATQQDVQALRREAEAVQSIRMTFYNEATALLDESYRSRMRPDDMGHSRANCSDEQACLEDPRKIEVERKTRDQVIAEDVPGKIVAVNGILNDEARALQLAYQNADPHNIPGTDHTSLPSKADANVYLMHVAPANNVLSELIGVAYERLLTRLPYSIANFLGYTAHMEEYARLVVDLGDQTYQSAGHSRGTLARQAAFTIISNRSDFTNPNLSVRGFAGAATAHTYIDEAMKVIGDSDLTDRVSFSYFDNDPVSVSVFSGGNPGRWRPSDLWSVFANDNSMHSCGGTGAPGCQQVEIPVPGGPQGTPEGNGRLIRFTGDTLQGDRP